jgi:hypothetical protein
MLSVDFALYAVLGAGLECIAHFFVLLPVFGQAVRPYDLGCQSGTDRSDAQQRQRFSGSLTSSPTIKGAAHHV